MQLCKEAWHFRALEMLNLRLRLQALLLFAHFARLKAICSD